MKVWTSAKDRGAQRSSNDPERFFPNDRRDDRLQIIVPTAAASLPKQEAITVMTKRSGICLAARTSPIVSLPTPGRVALHHRKLILNFLRRPLPDSLVASRNRAAQFVDTVKSTLAAFNDGMRLEPDSVTNLGCAFSAAVASFRGEWEEQFSRLPDGRRILTIDDSAVRQLRKSWFNGGVTIDEAGRVTSLWLPDHGLVDINPVRALGALRNLSLERNRIVDASPLADLRALTALTLSNNLIQDISPLAHLEKLEELCIEGNPIRDLGPLFHLRHLKILWLDAAYIAANRTLLEPLYARNIAILSPE